MYNLCDYLTYQCIFFVFVSNNVGSYDPRFDCSILRFHLLKTIRIFQGSCDCSRSIGSYNSDDPK